MEKVLKKIVVLKRKKLIKKKESSLNLEVIIWCFKTLKDGNNLDLTY